MEITLPPLHPAQREIADSPARFKIVVAGRRFGKTRLGVVLCLAVALLGGLAWWVSPSYPISLIGWRLLKYFAQKIPGTEIREAEHRIIFPGGGVVEVKSAHKPESLLGEGLNLVVVDEAATTKKEAWFVSLRPALTDTKGDALFITTPRGRNWIYHLWREAPEKDNWQAWRFPTSANPYIDPAEIAEAKLDMPALVFAQEFMAMFTEQLGAMFKRDWFEIIPEAPKGRYYRFWDLAASPGGDDWSVGELGGLIDGNLIVADVMRGQWSWPVLRRHITEVGLEDGTDVEIGLEQAAFQLAAVQDMLAIKELAAHTIRGVPVHLPGASVRAMYESLARDKAPKAARSAGWLARAEQKHVKLVRGVWNKGWLDRVCDFPLAGSPDDEIDATSGLMQMQALITLKAGYLEALSDSYRG